MRMMNCVDGSSSSSSGGSGWRPDNSQQKQHAEAPKSLSQLLLPHFSTPSLCIVSGLMLLGVHGTHFFEGSSFLSNGSNRVVAEGLHENDYNDSVHQQGVFIEALLDHGTSMHRCIDFITNNAIAIAPTVQSPFFYPTLVILTIISLLALQYKRLNNIIKFTSSIPGIEPVPNAHPYMGHYSLLLKTEDHPILFKNHATPSGITAFWGPGLKPCASVLLASHARLILRYNSHRDFSEWIIRHGRKTLGNDSLILIPGGNKWKNVRKVVARAFTNRIVRNGRKVIGVTAKECVDWIKRACDEKPTSCARDELSDCGEKGCCCQGHGMNEEGKGTVTLEVEDFFKLFSLNVFGRVAMGHDFRCVPTEEEEKHKINKCCFQQGNETGSNSKKLCTCLTMPPEALAFESLEADIGIRATPSSFLNPAMQFYSIPSKRNRTYKKNMDLVNGLMGGIIARQLDNKLRFAEDKEKSQREDDGDDNDQESVISMTSQLADEDAESNVLSYLLQACTEQHFSPEQGTRRRSSLISSSSSCPFSSSSSRRSSMRRSSADSGCPFSSSESMGHSSCIPSPDQISTADKDKIVEDVSKILHTLLVAGYGTTAISLSYVMYCLAKNPRCQERCCEEAKRVLDKKCSRSQSLQEHDIFDREDTSVSSSNQNNEEFDVDDDDLPYCRAVLTESIRLHLPILVTTRVLSKDLILETDNEGNKATLLEGTRVMINPAMIHVDERNFAKATEFIPERWVRWDNSTGGWVDRDYNEEMKTCSLSRGCSVSSQDTVVASNATPPELPAVAPSLTGEYTKEHAIADCIPPANPANFFSFSDGARNCVGKRLAVIQSTILIAQLLKDVCLCLEGGDDFELVKQRRFVTVKPVSMPIKFWRR